MAGKASGTSGRMQRQLAFLLLCALSSFCPLTVLAGDAFEEDNTFSDAGIIVINDLIPRQHDLHVGDDQDWIRFYGLQDINYQVEVSITGSGIDPVIELFDRDGTTLLTESNTGGPGGTETLLWHCVDEGVYFVRIRHDSVSPYGEETAYQLELITPDLLSFPGFLTGNVANNLGQKVSGARIKVTSPSASGSGLSAPDGSYVAGAMSGSYTVTVSADGHQSYSRSGVDVPGSLNVVLFRDNLPPSANADTFMVRRGGTVSGNVLANDSDADGDPLTALLDSDISHGTLSFKADGSFSYTHNNDSAGMDSFRYHVTDGWANSQTVMVNITIEQVGLPFLLLLLDAH